MANSEASVLDGIQPGPASSTSSAGFRLDNLRIGVRMAIVLTLPVLLSLWLGSEAILTARNVWVEQEKLGDLAVLATKISQSVHELQIERGMSAGFINSKGKSFASELPKQLGATDVARSSMAGAFARLDSATYSDELVRLVSSARNALAGLDPMRARVNSRQVTVAQMAQYYTPTIAKLLAVIEFMGSHNDHVEISNMITAYTAFLHGKESAGLERAMGAAGFGVGYFAPAIYQKFVGLIAAQDSYFSMFRNYASAGQIAFFEQTLSGAVVDEVNRMERIARNSESTGDTGGITGPQWFTAITKKIDLMKKVEDRIAGDLVARTDSLGASAHSTYWIRIAAVGGLTAFTLIFAVYMVRGITGPLTRLTKATTRLADGDTSSPIDLRVSADEVGTLVKAIKVFRENLIQSERSEVEQREAEKKTQETERRREDEQREAERAEVEKREADATERQRRADRLEEIIAAFDTQITSVVQSLSSAATEMQSSAEAMSATADQTSRQATAVAAASEEATTNVQTVASSAEELSASIEEISRQVTQSNQIAQNAVEEARQTNAKVEGLAEAAQKIGDVVNLINDIASQTNLLALNATIEAARAGDAGKGFAVVASEVKSLATQTGKATEEIAAQITAIQGATGEAVQAIQGIGITIGQLGEIATSVSSAVTQQGSATREIASSVQQAAAGTQEVSGNIAQVTQAAGEAQASSGQMLGAAKELAQQGEMLRKEVDEFLNEIRAA